MPRQIKTKSEIEALILERLQAMPNGDAITGVAIHVDDLDDPRPCASVGWIENRGDMRPFPREALRLAIQYCHEYEVRPDEAADPA